jgi:hypothetical protein
MARHQAAKAADQDQAAPAANADLADLAAVASELYALPLDEFTGARNQRARQVRQEGDRARATAIGKLAKPTLTAWLANQLVRAHGPQVTELLDLGDSMRQATASLDADQLRQLSRQQHQLISGLVRQASELAGASGQAVSEVTARALADTLHAALADEQAAGELSAGQLTGGLSYSGFPGIAAGPAAWAPPVPRPPKAPRRGGTADPEAVRREQLERAISDEAAATEDVSFAGQAREQATGALATAELSVRQAAGQVERIRADLDAALAAQTAAEIAQRQARKAVDQADRSVQQARRRLSQAIARRQEAERPPASGT